MAIALNRKNLVKIARQKIDKVKTWGFTNEDEGIRIRKTPKGTMTWYLSYNIYKHFGNGYSPNEDGIFGTTKNHRRDVGWWSIENAHTSIEEIRRIHQENDRMIRQGIDPKNPHLTTDGSATVRQLLDTYYTIMEQQKTKSLVKIKRLMEKNIVGIIDKPVNKVTKDDIRALFKVIQERPAMWTKRHFHIYLRKMFEYAADWEDYEMVDKKDIDFGIEYSPVPKLFPLTEAQKEQAREQQHITFEQIPALVNDENIDEIAKIQLKLCLSTGQRLKQIREATWSEIDWDGKTDADMVADYKGAKWSWTKERMKKKQPHSIPLTKLHIKLLTQLRKITGDSEYLFPHHKKDKPVDDNYLYSPVLHHQARIVQAEFEKDGTTMSIKEILKIKEIKEKFYHPHETRHTFKTLAASLGISKDSMDKVQHHGASDPSNTVYNQYAYMPAKKKALEIWCDKMEKVFDPDWKAE